MPAGGVRPQRVTVVGCGVVGAAIAYELSQHPHLTITVLEAQSPAQASTGAALGVLMGVISQKLKGRAWALRQASLRRYDSLIAELTAAGQFVPYNRQGILSLCFDEAALPKWRQVQAARQSEGWPLELWSSEHVQSRCPYLNLDGVAAGVYSPCDRQVDPVALTQALVAAAQDRGVNFRFDCPVTGLELNSGCDRSAGVHTAAGHQPADWVVIAAGLGSMGLTAAAPNPVVLGPVLGQALRIRLTQPLDQADFQPVINGHDIHLVPLGGQDYWLGATVEFPEDGAEPVALATALETLWQRAIAYCPKIARAEIQQQWQGLRPRPQGQGAPVLGPLSGVENVILATGHYRNGVLLAPATAQAVTQWIIAS